MLTATGRRSPSASPRTTTAIDNGSSGDEFHIKIWDDNGGGVICDNPAYSGDDEYGGTVIGGGNIKVHKK